MKSNSNEDASVRNSELLHSAILQAWKCALGDKKVIYLSGPITTGRQMLENIRAGVIIADEVIARENSAALVGAADTLRRELNDIVLEPATLCIPGWSQAEYLRLWKECIKRYVSVVMFMPGWQYSVGCVTEFGFAKTHGVNTQKIDGTELSSEEALALLDGARSNLYPDRQHPRLRVLYEALDTACSKLIASGLL